MHPTHNDVTLQHIRLTAYYNWIADGRPPRDDWKDWFQAECGTQMYSQEQFERVQRTANALWVARGRPLHDDWTDWFAAENTLGIGRTLCMLQMDSRPGYSYYKGYASPVFPAPYVGEDVSAIWQFFDTIELPAMDGLLYMDLRLCRGFGPWDDPNEEDQQVATINRLQRPNYVLQGEGLDWCIKAQLVGSGTMPDTIFVPFTYYSVAFRNDVNYQPPPWPSYRQFVDRWHQIINRATGKALSVGEPAASDEIQLFKHHVKLSTPDATDPNQIWKISGPESSSEGQIFTIESRSTGERLGVRASSSEIVLCDPSRPEYKNWTVATTGAPDSCNLCILLYDKPDPVTGCVNVTEKALTASPAGVIGQTRDVQLLGYDESEMWKLHEVTT